MTAHDIGSSGGAKEHQDSRLRPPRLYKAAAAILRDFREGKDSVKSLVFATKQTQFGGKPRPKHPNTKALFALVSNAVNHMAEVEAVISKMGLFSLEPKLQKELGMVLITELVWGKGELPGESLPVKAVLKYKKRIGKCVNKEGGVDGRALSETWPRYARVNPLKTTPSDIKVVLAEEGWKEIHYSASSTSHEGFLDLISNLGPTDYLSDLHLPDLLVFPPQTPLYQHSLVTGGSLLLQDKASCLPVACLNPPTGASLLDACAAPGMKTSQAAGAVGRSGKVVAVERSSKRAATLKEILAKSEADAVTTVLETDFLDVRPEEHPDVEYIVVDPSCSGTGMVLRPGDASEPPQDRLDKLAGLQTRLLLHALSFPKAKKVVYSTCATSLTENEAVVAKVLATCPGWKSASTMNSWPRRGHEFQGQDGANFLRAEPNLDLCNGFFVALLKRQKRKRKAAEQDAGAEEMSVVDNSCPTAKQQKKEKEELGIDEVKEEENATAVKDKKKKKKKLCDKEAPEICDNEGEISQAKELVVIEASKNDEALTKKSKKSSKNKKVLMANDNDIDSSDKKRKKKSKKSCDEEVETSTSLVDTTEDSQKPKKKKKKKDKD